MKCDAACIVKDNALFNVVPWLTITSLALFPIGRISEVPLAILAIIGLKVVFEKKQNGNWETSEQLFSLFFLCLWIPIIISLPDSYKVSKTFSLAIEYLRFFLSGLAILKYGSNIIRLKSINTYSLAALSIWIFYGLIHFFFVAYISGNASVPHWLNESLSLRYKLAMPLSVCSSLIIFNIYKKNHLLYSHILNFLCIIVLLLAGSRGGWIMYCVIITAFLFYRWRSNFKVFAVYISLAIACFVTVGTVLYFNSGTFADRINDTRMIFKGDEKSIDKAISLRVCIWKTAVSMISAHPINGVGARVFRYAYLDYAEKDDIFIQPDSDNTKSKTGAMHSHQMQLEVLSETGILGGLFFLGGIAVLVWYWRSRSDFQRSNMLPYAFSVAAIFFPLNTHPALYSSSWSQIIYWFVPLYFASGAAAHIAPPAKQ